MNIIQYCLFMNHKESKMNAMYRAYIEENDKIKKKEKYTLLIKEICLFSYALAIKSKYIGMDKASDFLIFSFPRYDKFIINFRGYGTVDFVYYVKRAIISEIKGYIRKDSEFNKKEVAINTINIINDDYMCDSSIDDNPIITETNDDALEKIFSLKTMRIFLVYAFALSDNDFIKELAMRMPIDYRMDFINSVGKLRKNRKINIDECDKARTGYNLNYYNKIKTLISDDKGEEEIKKLLVKYAKSRDNYKKLLKTVNKISYRELSQIYGIKEKCIGKYLTYAKQILENYKRERQEDEVYLSKR